MVIHYERSVNAFFSLCSARNGFGPPILMLMRNRKYKAHLIFSAMLPFRMAFYIWSIYPRPNVTILSKFYYFIHVRTTIWTQLDYDVWLMLLGIAVVYQFLTTWLSYLSVPVIGSSLYSALLPFRMVRCVCFLGPSLPLQWFKSHVSILMCLSVLILFHVTLFQ